VCVPVGAAAAVVIVGAAGIAAGHAILSSLWSHQVPCVRNDSKAYRRNIN